MSQLPVPNDQSMDTVYQIEGPVRPLKSSSSIWYKLGMVCIGLLIFGSGMVVGIVGTVKFIEKRLKAHLEFPEETPDKILPVIKRNLRLSDEQLLSIEPIIRKHHLVLMKLRKDVSPQIASEFQAIESEVAEHLDQRQQEIWQRWFDKMRWFWLPRIHDKPDDTNKTNEQKSAT